MKVIKIDIQGTYCAVPHSSRRIMIYDGDRSKFIRDDDDLTDLEVFLIIHECCANLKNKLIKVMKKKEITELARRFQRYHNYDYLNQPSLTDKLKDFSIKITGKYNEVPNSGRIIILDTGNVLTEGEVSNVLYESVCNLRNHLNTEKGMTREELTDLANKHNIHGFGMRSDETPFVNRITK